MGNTPIREGSQETAGYSYKGQMKGSKRHGKGWMKWSDGAIYEGWFKDNMLHGDGQMSFPNGNMYIGRWHQNNPHGKGVITTMNGERIEGYYTFRGRASHVPNAYHEPVAKYHVSVNVLDTKTHRAMQYDGPATLHLRSGLLVLPGMNDPNEPVFAYAEAVLVDKGKDLLKSGFENNAPQAVPVALSGAATKTLQSGPGSYMNEQYYDTPATTTGNDGLPLAQHLPDVGANGQTSVAYGYHDEALNEKVVKPRPVNILNPRNYY